MNTESRRDAGRSWSEPETIQSKHPHHRRRNLTQVLLVALSAYAAVLPTASTAQIQSLVEGNTAFGLNLYAHLRTNSENIFFSPYSISTCLAMTYAGARGNTAAQMAQVFGFDTNQEQLASSFGQLQYQLQADQETNGITLNLANALWTQIGYPFLPGFLQTAADQYQAKIGQADFSTDPDGAAQAINDWVADQTQNRIQNILARGALDPLTRLVLANAIYFKGDWAYPFEPTNTSIQPFYVSSTSQVDVPLMHINSFRGGTFFRYFQTADFQALELPYASNRLSMLVLLPTRIDGLGQLEQQLSPSFLSNVWARLAPQAIEVFLPRFTNDSTFNLTTTLARMGMPDAFAPQAADFSGMDGMRDLFCSFVVHKAWVQVDEVGSEAAAATVIGVGTSSVTEPPPPFRADHPFVYLIRDTRTGSLLFMGRTSNPGGAPGRPVPMPQLALSRPGNGLMLSWPYPSTAWTLQRSSDLSGTNWTTVAAHGAMSPGSPFTGIYTDGTNNLVPMLPSGGIYFFRLIRE